VKEAALFLGDPTSQLERLSRELSSVSDAAKPIFEPATWTPLNVPIGANRKFDWFLTPLERLQSVRSRYGCTLNDLVLAVTAGALRNYIADHPTLTSIYQVDAPKRTVSLADSTVRAMIPMSERQDTDGVGGNRLSEALVTLPLAEDDPTQRLQAIMDQNPRRNRATAGRMARLVQQIGAWIPSSVLAGAARAAVSNLPFNLVVTNIVGPAFPLVCGREVIAAYVPIAPVFQYLALTIGVFTYNGTAGWGFNADATVAADLDRFVRATEDALTELEEAAPSSDDGGSPGGRRGGSRPAKSSPKAARKLRTSSAG
jgi:WS/DGAT/MGAT family acyltransferase